MMIACLRAVFFAVYVNGFYGDETRIILGQQSQLNIQWKDLAPSCLPPWISGNAEAHTRSESFVATIGLQSNGYCLFGRVRGEVIYSLDEIPEVRQGHLVYGIKPELRLRIENRLRVKPEPTGRSMLTYRVLCRSNAWLHEETTIRNVPLPRVEGYDASNHAMVHIQERLPNKYSSTVTRFIVISSGVCLSI